MSAPFYPMGAFGDEAGFVIIFFLGLAFGFFLERAGFGSAKKLAAIFYFRDWAVLRVMFTAIVVAMVGLLYVGGLGWLVPEAMNIPATFLGAQIIGGLLLGVGFIVGGYCPGTSVVGAASGKLDAVFYLGGLLVGSFAFGAGYDALKPLYEWGSMGVRTLPEWFGVSPGIVAAIIMVIALAAFGATEYFQPSSERKTLSWKLTPERLSAAALGVLVFGLMVGYSMANSAAAQVRAEIPVQQQTATVPAASGKQQPTPAAGASPSAPAPLKLPAGMRKFKKGSSCS